MGDVMLLGVLRMPYDMAMGGDITRLQYHARGLEAAKRIEADQARIEALEAENLRLSNLWQIEHDHAKALTAERDAALAGAVKVRPLKFEWAKDESRPNPSCWRCEGDGFFAYVLIPYDPGNDPVAGTGKWNANPNHRGRMGFETREAAMAYCEDAIRRQAAAEVQHAIDKLSLWAKAAVQPDTETVEMAEAAAFSAGYEAGQRDEREACAVLASVRADSLDDAIKWGGGKVYLASLKGGLIELRNLAATISKRGEDAE